MIVTIDLESDRPRYTQIADGIEAAIAVGEVAPGDRLPPGRELASTLGVNLETVQRAYRRLVDTGIAEAKVGRGTRIADDLDPSTIGINRAIAELVETARRADMPLDMLLSAVSTRYGGR